MINESLLPLAQDLEWLGCELEFIGKQHAQQGFPGAGPTWDLFLEKQRGLLVTADKIEREIKNLVRYNPASVVGVEFPLAAALDAVVLLLAAVEEIKQSARSAVHELPSKVRSFTKMVSDYQSTQSSLSG
ncbi:MAG: hypothetical protein ABSB82_13660 [Terriglobia bacterium]|jgi:hypothetical protein